MCVAKRLIMVQRCPKVISRNLLFAVTQEESNDEDEECKSNNDVDDRIDIPVSVVLMSVKSLIASVTCIRGRAVASVRYWTFVQS